MARHGGLWLVAAGLSGAAAVGLGAYAAHALDPKPEVQNLFATAHAYHMAHSLALLAASSWATRSGSRWLTAAGLFWLAGITLFCGALYLQAMAGVRIGTVAPIGGTCLILGWLSLAGAGLLDRSDGAASQRSAGLVSTSRRLSS